ncbi:MAG: cytochrome c biogenesis protein ResB [Bacteroidales bacterium]|nr:cytochrome c biogenesis protein ResB [Bacteroidales bacterium]MDY0217070.1 cytochrome c biogenesis protein ResB [Bacteroidales bacterium]
MKIKKAEITSLKGSLIVGISIFIIGLILQLIFGQFPYTKLKFPVNLYVFAEVFFITLALWFLFKRKTFVKWLSSANAALASIALFTFVVAIIAIFPQGSTENKIIQFLGFNSVIYTWYYALAVAFFILVLGLSTLRRITPFRGRNIPFFINHFGLWLAMTTALLGFADKQQLTMPVHTGQLVWFAENSSKEIIELPFAIKLEKFVTEYHPPKMAILNNKGEAYKIKGDQFAEVTENKKLQIGSYNIVIDHYYHDAFFIGDSVINRPNTAGTTVAAHASVFNNNTKIAEDWLSPGNHMFPGKYIFLHPDSILVLLDPEPSYYGSEILLYTESGIEDKAETISVNKPLSAEGWTIYQHSFDYQYGKDSPYSVFSVVRDPWLPYVYSGIFLMMVGACWLIFAKVITKKTSKTKQL